MSTDPDVCVVGAGAGGALAAFGLVARGLRVRLLEAGARHDPESFGTHGTDWELRAPVFAETAGERSWEPAPGPLLDARFAALASRSPTSFAAPPPARRRGFFYSRALGVGGSTLHYQGEAHRFPPHAFRMARERGVAVDWPVDYEELAPYYRRVEQLLGVAGDADNPFKAAREPFPYAAHPLSAAGRRLAAAAGTLGWRSVANSLAILPAPRAERAACHYCNGCVRGCRVGAKGSVDVAVIPAAERSGRLELVTGFRAATLELARDGRVAAVLGRDAAGQEVRQRARAFVLAAGAIETPRLLLASHGSGHPHGIGNAADQVGRHLMETLYVDISGAFDVHLGTNAGVPIESRVWDFNGSVPGSGPEGFVLGHFVGSFEGPVGSALEGAAGFGRAHRRALEQHFRAGMALFAIAEQLPRAENRVLLAERRDAAGVPLARIETAPDETDLRALLAARERLIAWAEAAGLERISQSSAYDTPMATHVAGTCRMGSDPQHSVVDAEGRVHGVANLWIADASVLPTQGPGDSPSLTIQALALRSAERLAARGPAVAA